MRGPDHEDRHTHEDRDQGDHDTDDQPGTVMAGLYDAAKIDTTRRKPLAPGVGDA
jgi:hypothetical protein